MYEDGRYGVAQGGELGCHFGPCLSGSDKDIKTYSCSICDCVRCVGETSRLAKQRSVVELVRLPSAAHNTSQLRDGTELETRSGRYRAGRGRMGEISCEEQIRARSRRKPLRDITVLELALAAAAGGRIGLCGSEIGKEPMAIQHRRHQSHRRRGSRGIT